MVQDWGDELREFADTAALVNSANDAGFIAFRRHQLSRMCLDVPHGARAATKVNLPAPSTEN